MRAMRCDQCRAEVELANKYDEPADWFVVVQGAEDEITLCSIGWHGDVGEHPATDHGASCSIDARCIAPPAAKRGRS